MSSGSIVPGSSSDRRPDFADHPTMNRGPEGGLNRALPPLPADAGGGDRLVAAAEDQGVQEGLVGPAGEGRGGEVEHREIGPAAGGDPADGEPEGAGAARGRGAEGGAGDLALSIAEEAAALVAQALDELQPAHLLQPGEADVRVAPQAEAGPGGAHPGDVGDPVAQVGLGQRAEADVAPGGAEAVHVERRAVGTVNGGEAL